MTTKLPLPQLNGDVLDYDKLQTDRLNGEADYIIEIGSNASGTWEKWASGKLVQRSTFLINSLVLNPSIVAGIYASTSYPVIAYPIDFVSKTPQIRCSIAGGNGFGGFVIDNKTFKGFRLKPFAWHPITQSSVEYDWESVGRWKV